MTTPAKSRAGSKLNVILAEAPQLVRAGMSLLIQSQPDMQIAVETGDADEAIARISKLRARGRMVAVIGLGITGSHDAFWLIRSIRERLPNCAVIACGQHTTEHEISRALLVGADGFVDKDSGPVEFVDGVRGAAVGELVLTGVSGGLLGRIADGLDQPVPTPSVLTERELEVLSIATRGLTARQIGRRLGVKERTVTTHFAHIYRKLGAGSRVAAIAVAAQSGLVSVG